MTAGIVALHVALVYGLLQVQEVRDAAREVAPMFVDLIAPPAPPEPPPPPPPRPQPVPKRVAPAPLLAAAPSPAPTTFAVPEQAPPEPVQPPAPPAAAIVAPPAPAAVAAPQPRVIAASDVQYLEKIEPEYPRLSIRNGETGRVIVLVLIDERGLPQQVQIAKSSGFARLDGVALNAVKRSRFRPPTDNGRPVSGWTNVPFDFGLEK